MLIVYLKLQDHSLRHVFLCESWDAFNTWREEWRLDHPDAQLIVVSGVLLAPIDEAPKSGA